jgi:hypothetical protein
MLTLLTAVQLPAAIHRCRRAPTQCGMPTQPHEGPDLGRPERVNSALSTESRTRGITKSVLLCKAIEDAWAQQAKQAWAWWRWARA